jgi:hypothetical protein
MKTENVRIVDVGRGPQIEGQRLTVMDVFYYLHRGHDFAFIHQVMPSLTRAEFDAVVAYIDDHRQELADEDHRVEERVQQDLADLKAKGLHQEIDESVPLEVRVARLKEKARARQKEHAEKNGGHSAR